LVHRYELPVAFSAGNSTSGIGSGVDCGGVNGDGGGVSISSSNKGSGSGGNGEILLLFFYGFILFAVFYCCLFLLTSANSAIGLWAVTF
jgi:hypothetical protein